MCRAKSPTITVASPSQLKIERLEDDLCLFGKLCPQSCKKSSQNDAKDTFSVPHLTSVHKSSAFWTAGTGWENWFSNLQHPDTNICLTSLHLACAIPVFLMMYYDRLFVKPAIWLRIARPMCDGRPFASSLFRRLASRGPLFRGFPVWWPFHLAIYLSRCLTFHDQAPCCGERAQIQHSCLYCKQYTVRTCNDLSHDIGSSVCARQTHPCVMPLGDCQFSLRPSLCTLHLSVPSSTSSS